MSTFGSGSTSKQRSSSGHPPSPHPNPQFSRPLSTSNANTLATNSTKTIKLRLIAWDMMSKAEVCSYQNAPTLDLTLKLKKKWIDVVQYLIKKWSGVFDLQNRLQIFLMQNGSDHGIDCLVDTSLTVGQSIGNHPALHSSPPSHSPTSPPPPVPVVELYYHLRPISSKTTNPPNYDTFNSKDLAYSTDPTLQAFCEFGELLQQEQQQQQTEPPRNEVINSGSSFNPASHNSGKRSSGIDESNSRSVKQKTQHPPFSTHNSAVASMKYQPGSLEILNLPLFLNQNRSTSSIVPSTDLPDGVNKLHMDDHNHQDSNLQLAFIRDGLQAIAETPLSSLPALDITLDSSSSFKYLPNTSSSGVVRHSNVDVQVTHQFSSDTIAHLIDVMHDEPETAPNESNYEEEAVVKSSSSLHHTSHSPPLIGATSLLKSVKSSFERPLETIPEKISGSSTSPSSFLPSSSCESESELSNNLVVPLSSAHSQPISQPFSQHLPQHLTQHSRHSPDQSSQISLVESETIQDSDGDRPPHFASRIPATLRQNPPVTANHTISQFSVGIPKGIMAANKRKPHLKRINPTLIGPLPSNQPNESSWG